MKTFTKILITVLLTIFVLNIQANDIRVKNTSISENNTEEKYAIVQFDLQWQNSWRVETAQSNWDAAWVFVKYRPFGEEGWRHAKIAEQGHSAGSGTPAIIDLGLLDVENPYNAQDNPAMGVFIYRSQASPPAEFKIENAQLKFDYSYDDIETLDEFELKVFAIEMVYVPEGAFYVGSGGNERGHFHKAEDVNSPFRIESEDEIMTSSEGEGNLWGRTGIHYYSGVSPEDPHTIPEKFPKGFQAFYSMKYSITQQQYVDFLNTLTREQQNTRTATDLAFGVGTVANTYVMSNSSEMQFRNSIRCSPEINPTEPIEFFCDYNGNGIGGEEDDGLWIAANYLTYMDGAAYVDWAGLRPMTEFEYEKAARGTLNPVPNEYAWGTISMVQTIDYNNKGQASEVPLNSEANIIGGGHENTNGPIRVGAFATNSSNRGSAGASYYGIMELSGNVWERVVSVGVNEGRIFNAQHGDGILSESGNANIINWPGFINGEVTRANGIGFRGGNHSSSLSWSRLSDRTGASNPAVSRNDANGFRAVRTAP